MPLRPNSVQGVTFTFALPGILVPKTIAHTAVSQPRTHLDVKTRSQGTSPAGSRSGVCPCSETACVSTAAAWQLSGFRPSSPRPSSPLRSP